MSLTVQYSLINRDRDKIQLRLEGEYDSALTSASLVITDPKGVEYLCILDLLDLLDNDTEEIFLKVVEINTSSLVTNTEEQEAYPSQNFIDGSYSINLTMEFLSTPSFENSQYLLFLNNAVTGWIDLFLKSIGKCDTNKQNLATSAREYIQAAVELFRLTQFQQTRNLLLRAQDLADYHE